MNPTEKKQRDASTYWELLIRGYHLKEIAKKFGVDYRVVKRRLNKQLNEMNADAKDVWFNARTQKVKLAHKMGIRRTVIASAFGMTYQLVRHYISRQTLPLTCYVEFGIRVINYCEGVAGCPIKRGVYNIVYTGGETATLFNSSVYEVRPRDLAGNVELWVN